MAAAGADHPLSDGRPGRFRLGRSGHQARRPRPAPPRAQADFRAGRYDLVILIDYPGFHVRVAEAARQAGTKVLYYIAPQLWAWRPGRARRLRVRGGPARRGAPLRAAVLRRARPPERLRRPSAGGPRPRGPRARRPARSSASRPTSRVLGIFPGSRTQEIRRLWLPFRDAARGCSTRAAATGSWSRARTDGEYPDPGPLEIIRGDPIPVFAVADAALAKSGTTTLEAALADVPMVVAYKVHPLTWRMFQRCAPSMGEPGQPGRRAGGRPRDAAGPSGGRAPSPTRCGRCSIRATRARSPSAKGSPSSGSGWASRARRRAWSRWPTSCSAT